VLKMFEVPATSNGSSARDAGAGPRRPVVMVAGATGGVGKRVVRHWRSQSFATLSVQQNLSRCWSRDDHSAPAERIETAIPQEILAALTAWEQLRPGNPAANVACRPSVVPRRVLTQVEALLQRGKRVRALVRDEARGRQLLVSTP